MAKGRAMKYYEDENEMLGDALLLLILVSVVLLILESNGLITVCKP